jgi:hypothetical protein
MVRVQGLVQRPQVTPRSSGATSSCRIAAHQAAVRTGARLAADSSVRAPAEIVEVGDRTGPALVQSEANGAITCTVTFNDRFKLT